MAYSLTIEQINFDRNDLDVDNLSVDSLGSVVDANVDFNSSPNKMIPKNLHEQSDVMEKWKSSATLMSDESETVFLKSIPEKIACDIPKDSYPHDVDKGPSDVSDEGNAAFSYDSFGCSYPEIPLPVAQELNKSNPEWYTEVEKYIKTSSNADSLVPNAQESSFDSQSLPLFRAMAASSGALALQHSVIGNPGIKPVSPDVVAQVVANTMLRMQQQKLSEALESNKPCAMEHSVSDKMKQSSNVNGSVVLTSTAIDASIPPLNSTNTSVYQNESVLPKSVSSCETPTYNGSQNRRASTSSIASKKSSKSRADKIPIVHMSKKISRKLAKENSSISSYLQNNDTTTYGFADSETESCLSERFELESVCSEVSELESALEMCPVNEDSLQGNLVFSEPTDNNSNDASASSSEPVAHSQESSSQGTKPSSRSLAASLSKKDQSTETEHDEVFELMRAKANLEGQLENTFSNEANLNQQCTTLHTSVATLQSQLKAVTGQWETAIAEKQLAVKELDAQIKQQERWDSVIKDYQNVIEGKNSEVKALKEDLMESEQAHTQTRINFEELKIDMDSKDSAIFGLKKKIAELHVEVQGHLQGKVQLMNEVDNVKHDITSIKKSNEWYKDQLHSTQEAQNKLHQELIGFQSNNVSLNNDLEKCKHEANYLHQQLNECQHRAVTEKEMLMNHLETIEADMRERESLFEEIQKDKGTVENTLIERAKKMEEEHSKLTQLKFSISDMEYHLNATKEEVSDKEKTIATLEKEKVELTKQVTVLHKSVHGKDLDVQKYKQEVNSLERKVKHMEMSLSMAEELAGKLKEDKTASDVALASAVEEKHIVNESLKVVKDKLNQVENTFKHMKAELVAKTSKLEQLMKEKYHLEDLIRKAEETVAFQQKDFEHQLMSQNQNHNVLVDDLRKQKSEIENVLQVYNRDLHKNQRLITLLQNERNSLSDNVEKLMVTSTRKDETIEKLSSKNGLLLKKLSHLNVAQNDSVEGDVAQQNRQQLLESEALAKEQNLSGNSNFANSSVKIDQANNTDENPAQLLEEQKKMADLEDQLRNMLEQLSEERMLTKKNQEIIIQMEKELGKNSAISDSNSMLKQKNMELQALLFEREGSLAQLICQIKELEMKLLDVTESNKNRVSGLEEELNKEKIVIKSLRIQVLKEKRSNQHLQRQISTLKSGLEQANQTADSRKSDIIAVQTELQAKFDAELKLRGELERLQTEILLQKSETTKLQNELEEVRARDPALAEQIKSLSWHLKEKSNKIIALKEKQKLLEEQHSEEVASLKNSIRNLSTELDTYKAELGTIRKEKIRYQSQFAELRKFFKSNQSPNAPSSGDFSKNNNHVLQIDIPEPKTLDETYINNLLQRNLQVFESRPLNHLQSCLNSLKQEMAKLQKQLHDGSEDSPSQS